ncbi:hypothetical protein K435DRAFT_810560, partial [Dendrothele bispora CBS 962.96]
MARKKTKRSSQARKSTGGTAPRMSLGSIETGAQSGNKKRKLDTALDTESTQGNTNSTLDNGTGLEDEERLDYETHFAKLPVDAQWCRGCNDDTETAKVTCSDSQKDTYHGFYDSNGMPIPRILLEIRNRQFTWFKPLKLESLAMVQLLIARASQDLEIPYRTAVLCASAYVSGVVSVSDVLEHRLQSPQKEDLNLPSCPQPLLASTINFNLATEEGMNQYTQEMENLHQAVDSMGIERIVFCVVTHSDPVTGDLHFAPNGEGAERLEVVMGSLFSPESEDWLREKETYLFNLVCGSKLITANGYKHLQTYVTSKVFGNIFMFPTVHLQPHGLTSFITNLLEN